MSEQEDTPHEQEVTPESAPERFLVANMDPRIAFAYALFCEETHRVEGEGAPGNDTVFIARLGRTLAVFNEALDISRDEISRLKSPREPGKPGRKPIGERAMTAAERMRRMRLRNKEIT